MDDKARSKFKQRQKNSDTRWKRKHKNHKPGKFAAPYGMNLCFKCIELAVKHGKDTIEAVQPGVKMDIEAAKAAGKHTEINTHGDH